MTGSILVVEKHSPVGSGELLAARHAAAIGWDVRWAPLKDMRRNRVDIASAALVAGHLPFVLSALRQLGVESPEDDCYPEALAPYLRRATRRTTLHQAVAHVEAAGSPIFVKPTSRSKRFTGFVLESPFDPRLAGIPGKCRVEERVAGLRGR